jgi:hypothetical protein
MLNSESVCVCEQYGPVQVDVEYAVIKEGYDYVMLRCHGNPICVPSMFVVKPSHKEYKNYLPSYEDIISEEDI